MLDRHGLDSFCLPFPGCQYSSGDIQLLTFRVCKSWVGSRNTSGCRVHSSSLSGEAVSEHPLGMEQAGTEVIQGTEVQPLSPSGSQSGCRNRQAGKELGCWKLNSREGVTVPGASPTYFPGGYAEAPGALGLLGCSLCQRLAGTQ